MEALRRAHTVRSTTAGNVLVDEGTDHERDITSADWDQMAMGWDGTADGLESMGWEAAAEAMRDAEDEAAPEMTDGDEELASRLHEALAPDFEAARCADALGRKYNVWVPSTEPTERKQGDRVPRHVEATDAHLRVARWMQSIHGRVSELTPEQYRAGMLAAWRGEGK